MKNEAQYKEELRVLLDTRKLKRQLYEQQGGPTREQQIELSIIDEDISDLRKSLRELAPKSSGRTHAVAAVARQSNYVVSPFEADASEQGAYEQKQELCKIVKTNTANQAEMLQENIVNGKTRVQIAEEKGLSQSTVSRTITRGINSMQARASIYEAALRARDDRFKDFFVIDARTRVGRDFLEAVLSSEQYHAFWGKVVDGINMTVLAKERGISAATVSRNVRAACRRLYAAIPPGALLVVTTTEGRQKLINRPPVDDPKIVSARVGARCQCVTDITDSQAMVCAAMRDVNSRFALAADTTCYLALKGLIGRESADTLAHKICLLYAAGEINDKQYAELKVCLNNQRGR